MKQKKRIVILGSGISALSAAALLAREGHEVNILEKNETTGGRARVFSERGFTFDMGPSWYWMPEVFENFYRQFGHTTSDFYELKRLDPSYKVIWQDGSSDKVPSDMQEFRSWFETMEPGAAKKLDRFLEEARYKYEVGMGDLVYKPGLKLGEFADMRIVKGLFKLHLFSGFSKYIRKYFKHRKILSLLEFPILFLGALPEETPALYSLMNYADISLGTWYPMGGMHRIIEAFEKIAREQGVRIHCGEEVTGFRYKDRRIVAAETKNGLFDADLILSGADYHHTDTLLAPEFANYSEAYWNKRVMAPSCLLFYIGTNKRIDGLQHHNLFFDESFEKHAHEIYKEPSWPDAPLFYACCPSKTDPDVAPEGGENLFLLVPLATGLEDTNEKREACYDILMKRLEAHTGQSIREHVVYSRSYCINDFKKDYHAFRGNAYGLANTLRQTAILKPRIKNKKLENLYYTGQLTVPGPGVPPSIISGEVVARQILKENH